MIIFLSELHVWAKVWPTISFIGFILSMAKCSIGIEKRSKAISVFHISVTVFRQCVDCLPNIQSQQKVALGLRAHNFQLTGMLYCYVTLGNTTCQQVGRIRNQL